MLKTFLIGLKDVRIVFRDRTALIFMLAAPFVITLGMGLVTGGFSSMGGSGISNIPVVIVNLDQQNLGNALVDIFQSRELVGLVEPAISPDPAAARASVDQDKSAAAIIIPAGFTQGVIGQNGSVGTEEKIEVYANPSRPTSAGIIKSIIDEFISRLEEERIGTETVITRLVLSGRISAQEAAAVGAEISQGSQTLTDTSSGIQLHTTTAQGEAIEFNILAYLAPGMALMFLMSTVSYGGRSILAEKAQGTLARMLISPTSSMQILGGKVFGIFLTGVAQMLILIGATTLLFQLKWGDLFGVLVLVLAAVFGATGWGLLITALARTPAQVGSVGTAVMLIFGIMGGSFIQLSNMPPYVQTLSRITPNSWALDGFATLGLGGTLADLATPITALLTMGILLFLAAALLFGRRDLVQK